MDYEDFSGSDVSSNTSHTTDTGELDVVFFECDTESKGNIPVSRLLHYLREHVGFTEQGQNVELDSLCSILDPDDDDIAIDIDTFRKGVLQWMSQVQEVNENNMNISPELLDEKCDTSTIVLRSRLASFGFTSLDSSKLSLLNASVNNYIGRDNMLNQSIETTGLASAEKHQLEQEIDVGEVLSHVETLKFQNRKLLEENSQLKEQMVAGEDASTQLTQKVEALHRELKTYQGNQERMQELIQENEDLKLSLDSLTEEKKELKIKMRQMEKDTDSLENSKLVLEGEIKSLAVELDCLNKVRKDLQTSLSEEKKIRTEVERITDAQESELMEKGVKIKEMEKMMKHLNKVNETLRQEKNDVEMQLSHTQHELASMQIKSEHMDLDGSVELDAVTSLTEDVMPVIDLPPSAASTPFKATSLCTEIVLSMHDEPSLPSPLCDKEYEGVVDFNFSEEFEDDVESMVKSHSNLKKMPGKIAQVASKLKQRNEIVIQQIDQLITQPLLQFDSPVKPAGGAKPGVVKSILQKELTDYTDKIEMLVRAKTAAEKKIVRLTETLKTVQEESKASEERNTAELDKLQLGSQNALNRLEEQLEVLRTRLTVESAERDEISASSNELKEQVLVLQRNISDLEKMVSDLKSGTILLENDLQEQKDINRNLTEEYQQSKDALDQLEEEYQRLTCRRIEEEEKACQLEDKIRTLQLKRQIDWRELWRLVQTDSELSDSADDLEVDAGQVSNVLRDQVTQEIEYLKTELIKSQATLKILQTQSPKLKGKQKHSGQNGARNRNNLVDALNLDCGMGEGDHGTGMTDVCGQRPHSSNTLDPTYGAHSNLTRTNSSSCPDFDQYDIEGNLCLQSASRTDGRRNAMKRRERDCGKVDYSSSSGTSGIEIASQSNRMETMKNVLFTDNSNCSPETISGAEDTSGDDHYSKHSPVHRQQFSHPLKFSPQSIRDTFKFGHVSRSRTHSFKNAIERGPSGDSGISNPSQDRHDNSSTSLDLSGPRIEDLLPHESDLIKVGLYTDKNRVNLKHSSFRSGYYDRDQIHVPYQGNWNSHKEQTRDDQYTSQKYNTFGQDYIDQIETINDPKGYNYSFSNGRNLSTQNYDSIAPAVDARRLSILPEKDEKDVECLSNPIRPPRRNRNGKAAKTECKNINNTDAEIVADKSDTESHLVAHHLPTDVPIKSPRLKKTAPKPPLSPGRKVIMSDTGKDEQKKQVVPNFSKPPSYEQAVETRLKEKMATAQSERVGPSCDGVCAFEAVHSVPFSRPPPPYQKPFQQNMQNQSKTPQTLDITEEGESVVNSNLTKVGNSSGKNAETLGFEKQDLELAEFSNESDKKDSACKNNDIAELDSFEGQSSGRRKSLEIIHNQPCLGSKEDVNATMDEVESKLSSLSISANQQLEGKQQEAETGDTKPCTEKRDCAKSHLPLEEELSRAISFDEGEESVKTETTESPSAATQSKTGSSESGKSELLAEEEVPAIEATWPKNTTKVENVDKEDLSTKDSTQEKEVLSSKMEDLSTKDTATMNGDIDNKSESFQIIPSDPSNSEKTVPISLEEEKRKTIQAKIFPSLSDKMLVKWGLKRKPGDPLDDPELLTEQQVEERYTNVVLCFKTDKQTLDQRVELHQRARDTTEQNIKEETEALQKAMAKLEPFCNDLKSHEIFASIQKHLEILEISTDRLACRAETLGAAQQEFRISRAVDIIVKQVENLKHQYETEHQELEETKRMIQENKVSQGGNDRNVRHVTTGGGGTKFGRRRASVAVVRGMQPLSPLNLLSVHSPKNVQTKDDSTVQYADPSSFKDLLTSLSSESNMASSFPSSSSNPSPTGVSAVSRRRASVAVSSVSPERSSLLSNLHPSLLAYRNPRYNSLSSTSSEDTVSSRGSFTIPGIVEQAAEEEESSSEKPSENVEVISEKPKDCEVTETAEAKKEETDSGSKSAEASNDSGFEKLPPDKEDANNNNNNSITNNNNTPTHVIKTQYSEPKMESVVNGSDVALEEEIHNPGGLTDDSKLIMFQSVEQQYEAKILELQQALAEMQRRESRHTSSIHALQSNLFERLWRKIPPKEELKLRLRYTLAGMIFFAAVLCFIMTFVPTSDASERHRYNRHLWTSLEEMLWPYLTLKRSLPPPF